MQKIKRTNELDTLFGGFLLGFCFVLLCFLKYFSLSLYCYYYYLFIIIIIIIIIFLLLLLF